MPSSLPAYLVPVSLPSNQYPPGPVHDAYSSALGLEAKHAGGAPLNRLLIYARTLGYMIHEAPTDEGRTRISEAINACQSDRQYNELAEAYLMVIWCFKSRTLLESARTPVPALKHGDIDWNEHTQRYDIVKTEGERTFADARREALVRDNFRCIVSRRLDQWSEENVSHAKQNAAPGEATACGPIHVIPLALGHGQHPASVWEVLGQYGGFGSGSQLRLELAGERIHRLENILTLRFDLHEGFSRLHFWLEPTDAGPNRYRVTTVRGEEEWIVGVHADWLPRLITFESADRALPLPDHRYLALHAAFARVAHRSGAGRYVEDLVVKLQPKDMPYDGSTPGLIEMLRAVEEGRPTTPSIWS